MIYSTPVLSAASTLVFLLEILLDIKHALRFQVVSLTVKTLLLAIPWIFFFFTFFFALGIGITQPSSLERHPSGMFCHLTENLMGQITTLFVLVFIQLMLIVGVWIATTIRREGINWIEKSRSFNFIIRITLFVMIPLIAICVLGFQYFSSDLGINVAAVNVVYAILPTLAAATFSNQKDILSVWKFWPSAEGDDDVPHTPSISRTVGSSYSSRTQITV
ncbi:hypothetical protein CPB83DRAFT_415150 [Crepidotus variabilis]|uniref:Uncharacterized protein n=1 Tax=Crepidotus variabilis TaxID=179855 RepID=A0A9P6JUX1_9AGAR|nr:hypothetical protein CPB83DRAFT_415150 [Crepidotus variabilis]